jgi:hypothetical protein
MKPTIKLPQHDIKDRERLLFELPILEGDSNANIVEIDLNYQLGGWNFFTGSKEGRGIYLSVSPIEKGDGYRGFIAFSGTKILVKELNRYSDKQLRECEVSMETIEKVLNHVIEKNNLVVDKSPLGLEV